MRECKGTAIIVGGSPVSGRGRMCTRVYERANRRDDRQSNGRQPGRRPTSETQSQATQIRLSLGHL